jgi:hypothetical protein
MTDVPDEILSRVLAIPEAKLYEKDEALLDERCEAAGELKFEGLAVACPPRLKDSRLPLLVLAQQPAARAGLVKPYDNRIVVAAPLGRGAVSVGPCHPRRPASKNPLRRPPRTLPEGGGGHPATITSLLLFEVSSALSPLLPDVGPIAVRLIEWDRVSNTVMTVADAADPDEPTDAVYHLEDAAELHRIAQSAPSAFARSPASPELDGLGVAVAAPEPWPAGAAGVVLRGKVRTAVDASALVVPTRRDSRAHAEPLDPASLPRAILSGALLLVQRGVITPARVDFAVPVYAPAPLEAGAVVEGWFSIDLERALRGQLANGEHLAYAVVGAHTSTAHRVVVG